MSERNIEIHVEKLILDGLSGKQLKNIDNIIKEQLNHLISNTGIPSFSQDLFIKKVSATNIEILSQDTSLDIGKKVSNSIYNTFLNLGSD